MLDFMLQLISISFIHSGLEEKMPITDATSEYEVADSATLKYHGATARFWRKWRENSLFMNVQCSKDTSSALKREVQSQV